jgi:hypothetical protein
VPVIEEVIPNYQCTWDEDKNDKLKKKFIILQKFREISTRVTIRNRLRIRLELIKKFLGNAKSREEVKKMVELDHQKAEYSGIGKKGIIFYSIIFF